MVKSIFTLREEDVTFISDNRDISRGRGYVPEVHAFPEGKVQGKFQGLPVSRGEDPTHTY